MLLAHVLGMPVEELLAASTSGFTVTLLVSAATAWPWYVRRQRRRR